MKKVKIILSGLITMMIAFAVLLFLSQLSLADNDCAAIAPSGLSRDSIDNIPDNTPKMKILNDSPGMIEIEVDCWHTGHCQICDEYADYDCSPYGSYGGYNEYNYGINDGWEPCPFSDPIPSGHIVTKIEATVQGTGCPGWGGSGSMHTKVFLNGRLLDGGTHLGDCGCGVCFPLIVASPEYVGGFPGYIYGGSDQLFLEIDGVSCFSDVHLRLYYSPAEPGIERSFTESTLFETLLAQQAALNDVTVSGDFTSTLDFTDFEIVSITTGSFAGKGFSKGEWQATLGGISYTGNWQGALFLKPQEKKIYLKGAVSGEISATVEGSLTESVPGSGTYDQYEAAWRIGRLGGTITSATINLTGAVSYESSSEFTSAELYVLQTNLEGNVYGDYSGPLSTVLTHLRVVEETNPYSGEGFSIMSYNSESGSGEGFTYDRVVSPSRVELKGLFASPLFGIVSGILDESSLPRTLFLNIERVDLGLPPAADLAVRAWGPTRVSPGQTISYVIEYRNDGLKAADDVIVFNALDPLVKSLSALTGGNYDDFYHQVAWNLGEIPPKTTAYLSVQGEVEWGLPWGIELDNYAYIIDIEGASNSVNLAANGINRNRYKNPAGWGKWNEFSYLVDASQIPNLYESGSMLQDISDVQGATPVEILGYEDGRPIIGWDPQTGQPIYGDKINSIITIEGKEYGFTSNDNNGLKYFEEMQKVSCNTVFAYSGGTRTVITAILSGRLECDRVVLISPMSGMGDWGHWKWEIEQIQKTRLQEGLPRLEIVVYQSKKDLLATKFLSWFFQVKFSSEDMPWLEENSVKVNPPTLEANGRKIEIDDKDINKQNHGGLLEYINAKLKNEEEMASSASSVVAVARDPNIKYGPEGSVQPGQTLNYEVEFENEGEGIAFGVYVTDVLDGDLDAATLTVNDGGTYNPSTRAITWMIGQVNPHEGGTVSFSVNLKGDAAPGTEVINYATVYFPSVPEVTRTNGVVCRVPVGGPPVADAGPDQVLECSSSDGAEVTLDATGSSDPDHDPLAFTWRKEGSNVAGPTPDPTAIVTLGFGNHTIELTVDDGQGGTDTDEVMIRVVDTTAPNAVALLIPQTGTGEGVYRVLYKASDVCDSTRQLIHLDINSITVSDGQLVTLRAGDEFKYRTLNGMLEMQGNRLVLRCTAQDASENIGIGQTTPVVTARGKGFWAHQFSNASGEQFDGGGTSEQTEDGVTYFTTIPKGADSGHSGADSVHEPTQKLVVYLNVIRNEFDVFDWLIDEPVDEVNYERISKNVSALLMATGKSMRSKAQCHVLALLLDLASNRLARNTVVSPDDLLLDALEYVFPVLADSSASKGDLERVKGIAEAISNGELLADADLIPGGSLPGLLVTGETVSEIEEKPTSAPLPREFTVSQSYPNPFNPMATITYALPTEGKVTIEIYDIVGRKVVTLFDATEQAGYHSVVWYGKDSAGNSVASGVYFCRVQLGNKADVKKMILLR